jgi:hypothetical protein
LKCEEYIKLLDNDPDQEKLVEIEVFLYMRCERFKLLEKKYNNYCMAKNDPTRQEI